MKICIDCGHCLSGADTGAVGNGFKEQDKDREVGRALKKYLEQKGHSVVMTNVDGGCTTVNQSLQKRVNVANASKADFFISLHLDAASSSANGSCPFVYSLGGQAEVYAKRILNKMVGLGFANRGVRVANHYVTRCTNMPAVLLELCFITSPKDMGMFNADKMGKAIAEAILNENIQESSSVNAEKPVVEENHNAIADVDMNLVTIDRSSVLGNIKKGDKIKIKDFSNELKMMLVEVNGVIGFIPCDSNISLINKDKWINGGSIEKVYGDNNKIGHIDTLPPHKTATVLKKENGMYFIVYENDQEIRAGFVEFGGC